MQRYNGMNKIWIPIVAILLLTSTSCKKDKTECNTTAIIRYTGAVPVDGCDWVAVINGQMFHPVNLSDNAKQDSLQVQVNYVLTGDSFYCGSITPLPEIKFTCFNY